jgi:CRP-like cAMP-binding protein
MSSADPDRKQFLRTIALFGGLEEGTLERIDSMLVEQAFSAGAVICGEGDQGRSMYVVRSGDVEVRRSNNRGNSVALVRLGPGEFFGEMTLVEIQPRSATVVAAEPATLYSLTNRDLYKLYTEDLDGYVMVLQNICRQLARRLRKADTLLVELLSS